jgi:hypothetical protein
MKGIWVWPESESEQKKIADKIRNSESLLGILSAIAKSKDGLSNAQIDLAVRNNSQWNTRWPVSELLGLRFIEYKVDLFGDPGKYTITELGKNVLQRASSQLQPKPAAQH